MLRWAQYLDALHANVDDLPQLAAEWSELPEGEQIASALHWDHLMSSYLTELDVQYRTGVLPLDLQTRYRVLLEKLQAVLPLLERLRLTPLPVPLQPMAPDRSA